MRKPTKHLTEALKHLDRAIEEIKRLDNYSDDSFDTLWGAIEDAQGEIKDCRDASSDLLDDLRIVTE